MRHGPPDRRQRRAFFLAGARFTAVLRATVFLAAVFLAAFFVLAMSLSIRCKARKCLSFAPDPPRHRFDAPGG